MPPEAFYQQHEWALQWQHLQSQKPNYIQKWVDIYCVNKHQENDKGKELNIQDTRKNNKDEDLCHLDYTNNGKQDDQWPVRIISCGAGAN